MPVGLARDAGDERAFHGSQQRIDGERLAEVIVCSERAQANAALLRGVRAKHDHRDVGGGRILAQFR